MQNETPTAADEKKATTKDKEIRFLCGVATSGGSYSEGKVYRVDSKIARQFIKNGWAELASKPQRPNPSNRAVMSKRDMQRIEDDKKEAAARKERIAAARAKRERGMQRRNQ